MKVRCKMWTGPVLVKEYGEALRKAGIEDILEGTETIYWSADHGGLSEPMMAIWNTATAMAKAGILDIFCDCIRVYGRIV